MSGALAAGGPQNEPPWTNRGVLRPDDREQGGVDYLKLTVWAPVEEVCECLGTGVLDRYGWSVDRFNPDQEWVQKAAGGRASCVHDAGCLCVVEYEDAVTRQAEFCSVEVKGAGCAHLGNTGVLQLLTDLQNRFKVRASRVDLMAHTEYFEPSTAYQAVRDGGIRSRTKLEDKHSFIISPSGDTLYLGFESKPAGGMKRSGDRALRIYNRRGLTRVEIQLTGAHAHGAGSVLFDTDLTEWPMLIRGMLRDYCDFVDAESDHRPTRRALLPWWKSFVQEAEKISVRQDDNPSDATIVGRVDGILQRFCGCLFAAQEAYGEMWIAQRIARHGKLRRDKINDHDDLVRELNRYLGTGWAGIPDPDDETPF